MTSFHEWAALLPDPEWLAQMRDAPIQMMTKKRVGNRWITQKQDPIDLSKLIPKDKEMKRRPTPRGADPKGRGITTPGAFDQQERRKEQRFLDVLLAPLHRVAKELEEKWGMDRLQGLVSEELASRFAAAAQKLEEAIAGKDTDRIKERAEIMRRGWLKLDEAAEAAGHEPWATADVWEGRRPDGKTFLLVKDSSVALATNRDTGLGVWTMQEIGRVLQAFDGDGMAQAVKEEFGAELAGVTSAQADGAEKPVKKIVEI